jgi:pimeloyl-ACP methyl ester carboxylesterase
MHQLIEDIRSRLSPPEPRGRGLMLFGALVGVATLGAAAFAARRWTQAAEAAHPPIGSFIEVDGVRLRYFEKGSGPPVVFLHGDGSMIEDFTASGVVDQVANHHRVVVIERPGFGYSSRPLGVAWTPRRQARLLRKAFRQLGIEKPVVVAHSWGALVALALALERTDVAGLVLLAGYYYPTLRIDTPLFSLAALPVVGDIWRHTFGPFVGQAAAEGIFRRSFAPDPIPAAFRSGFPMQLVSRPLHLRASARDTAYMTPAAFALSRRYRQIDVPVTLIAGDQDHMVDFGRHSQRLAREIRGAKLVTVPGGSHMVHYQAPDKVVQAVMATSWSAPAQVAMSRSEEAAAPGAGS